MRPVVDAGRGAARADRGPRLIDVTDIPGVEEGDEVVIFSAVPGNTPEDMARVLDTIPYEVMTSVSGRVKRIYSKE